MIMITGGAYQGKRDAAKRLFGLTDGDILDGGSCDISGIENARCIRNYELVVKRLMEQGKDPLKYAEELDCDVIVMNEIGCGIIPLEKSEREWREMTGRAGCIIAGRSEAVYRVCCGIVTVIKGEEN